MKIKDIRAREILNSGGTASLEATVILEDGSVGRASVPFGASVGTHEAYVLFDGGTRFGGQGMQKAAQNVNTELRSSLIGEVALNQARIDEIMIELDGTANKSRLGANAILGVSLAVANAVSKSRNFELYEYIEEIIAENEELSPKSAAPRHLPKPMIVVIEGGRHADNSTDFQEYLIVPEIKDSDGNFSARESIRAGAEVYLALKKILKEKGYNTNIGNEGAYAPSGIQLNDEPWDLIAEAVERAGYALGEEIKFAADPACSELLATRGTEIPPVGFEPRYYLKREGRTLSSEALVNYFANWVDKYPFISLEDILAEDDWENWARALKRFQNKVRIIGDDLLVTNPDRLKQAIQSQACDGILVKLNQIGTLTETIRTIALAKRADFWTIVSHRGGGETNDTSMVDLAVAAGCDMVKVGISRGERVCKYNRLMEIEDKIRNPKSEIRNKFE